MTHRAQLSISRRMKGLPTSMRAVIATGAGDLAVVERPVPMCGRGEVLVKVAAAGSARRAWAGGCR